jgi:hypothetical protein
VIETTSQLIVGAASLRTGSLNPNTNEKLTYGCLLKIEMQPQQPHNAVQVTARTISPAATTAILRTTKSLLS